MMIQDDGRLEIVVFEREGGLIDHCSYRSDETRPGMGMWDFENFGLFAKEFLDENETILKSFWDGTNPHFRPNNDRPKVSKSPSSWEKLIEHANWLSSYNNRCRYGREAATHFLIELKSYIKKWEKSV